MTNEKAEMILRNMFYEIANADINDERAIALQIGLEALEKQTPKKPVMISVYEGKDTRTLTGACPCCACGIADHMNYCDCCGQKLDWKEKEK